jgi:hypothetical protein
MQGVRGVELGLVHYARARMFELEERGLDPEAVRRTMAADADSQPPARIELSEAALQRISQAWSLPIWAIAAAARMWTPEEADNAAAAMPNATPDPIGTLSEVPGTPEPLSLRGEAVRERLKGGKDPA